MIIDKVPLYTFDEGGLWFPDYGDSRCLARSSRFASLVIAVVHEILRSPSTRSHGRIRGPRELIKMRELNATACAALHEGVEWSSLWNVVTLIVLGIVNIMVVVGNVLVILAVYCTNKLRNVTNMFIVSLAVADLMVGVAVLPFSATWEVYKVSALFVHYAFYQLWQSHHE